VSKFNENRRDNSSIGRYGLSRAQVIYTRLDINEKEHQLADRGLVAQQIEAKLLKDIRQATNKGLVLGNEHFSADIGSLTRPRVTARK
jgi:hypothetical protein